MDELNQVFLETHPQTRIAEIKSGNFFVKKHSSAHRFCQILNWHIKTITRWV